MVNLINSVTVTGKVSITYIQLTGKKTYCFLLLLLLYYVGYLCGDCKDSKGVSTLLTTVFTVVISMF